MVLDITVYLNGFERNLNNVRWLNVKFTIRICFTFSMKDRIEMSLFVIRYICGLLIFVIGLKAPGLATPRHDDDEELLRPDQVIIL